MTTVDCTEQGDKSVLDAEVPDLGESSETKVFYNEKYVVARHGFETTRKAAWVAEKLKAEDECSTTDPHEFVGRTQKLIEEAHTREYVYSLTTGEPRQLAESQGFSWDPGIWEMAVNSTAGVVAAVDEVISEMSEGRVVNAGSLSSGLHHARSGSGAGFCTVNGLAVGVKAARQAMKKSSLEGTVVVLDVDAHCGGGTHSILRGSEGTLHLDLSVNSFDCYEPAGGNRLSILRSPSEKEYFSELDGLLGCIPADTKLVLYNAGMDPHPTLSKETLRSREERVAGWCAQAGIPAVFVLAGGYLTSLDKSELVDLHLHTVKSFRDK